MKWAIIGLGYISQKHIDSIKSINGKLVAVCDIDESKKIDGIPFYTSYKEMIDETDADWIAVCAPNYLHLEMCLYAEKKGKKVLCEKPLTLNSKDISKLKNTYVVLQLRYHQVLNEILESLKEQNDVSMNITVKRGESYWKGWKGDESKSGGVLFNIGIHYFDVLRLLFGDKYEIVESFISPSLAVGFINFPNANVEYRVEVSPTDAARYIDVNGKRFAFSYAESLALEDLHKVVYEELKVGRGLKASEAINGIKLVESLKKFIDF